MGMSTGIRIPKGDQELDELKSRIKQHISAKDAGLEFIPLRERAMISAKGSINLGEYIGYFSFFIIVAALALTGMLFIFSIEQRNQQTGLRIPRNRLHAGTHTQAISFGGYDSIYSR